MAAKYRIVEVKLTLTENPNSPWLVAVTKEFLPESGGGADTVRATAYDLDNAIEVARGLVFVARLAPPRAVE